MSYKIGQGYDVHQLKENLPLILGGVQINFHKGVVAHSDGDVLAHAIADSILGALAIGDLGTFFPEQSKWENISGLTILKHVKKLLKSHNQEFIIQNIDSTIILQSPKLSPYIEQMRNNISNALDIDKSQISVKATTTDKLGFIGSGQGLAVEAICLIKNE